MDRLEIRWPGGFVQVWEGIPAGRVIRVVEGEEGYQLLVPLEAI